MIFLIYYTKNISREVITNHSLFKLNPRLLMVENFICFLGKYYRVNSLSHSVYLAWNLVLQIQKSRKLIGDSLFNTILIKILIQVEKCFVLDFFPFDSLLCVLICVF